MLRALNQAVCFHRRLEHHSEIREVWGVKFLVSELRCARCDKVMWGDAEHILGED